MATIFFSGALWKVGWGCIGGRPKEIARQAMEEKKKLGLDKKETFDDDEVV
jgi:hypothetical protein